MIREPAGIDFIGSAPSNPLPAAAGESLVPQFLGSKERAILMRRRELLWAGAALPIVAGAALARSAYGFSREEMPAQLAKQYRDRCAADPVHAPTLEAAFARLDVMGIKYNRDEVAASLRCPICGCPILSVPGASPGQGPPSF
jgi:hypothetical protein